MSSMLMMMMQEEEALAQALANGNMDPQDDLLPEEEEQLGYPEDEAQQDTLEQVRTIFTCSQFAVGIMPWRREVRSLLCADLQYAMGYDC